MKATVFYKREEVKVEDVPEPRISDEYDVKIKVSWCGICGSDMEEYLYGPIVTPTKPHPLTNEKIPLILGHEFCGEVVSVGNNVFNVKIGDKVASYPVLSCGSCYWCIQNVMCLCEKMACIGLQRNGAFAEYVVVPHKNCYKVEGVKNFEYMALVEPTATAYRAVKRANINLGDHIVIIGSGTIGLLVLQIARLVGADKIIVLDILKERMELAKKLGAHAVLNPRKDNVKKEINRITGNKGVNTVIECAGNEEAPALACDLVNKGGTVILVGVSPKPSAINTTNIVISEKKIYGVHGYDSFNFEKCITLISENKLSIGELITKKIHLEDIVKDGLEELRQRPEKNIKILVTPK